ncbi:MAG: UvrD-helicase domain-containing protein, partial [Bacillota bacterium]
VKQLYGGLGKNFMNPALVGRAALVASCASEMTRWMRETSESRTQSRMSYGRLSKRRCPEELKKPDADRAMLTRQLSKLPSASIGTFHSFAFDIVRQYFYLIDIEPGFGVADDVQIEIMKREAVDNVFARRYEENSEEFRDFVLKYGGNRNDSSLRDNVLETCKLLSSIHKGIEWAYGKAEQLAADDPVEAIGGYAFMADRIMAGLEEAEKKFRKAADMMHDNGLALCYGVACDDLERLEELIAKAKAAFACPGGELKGAIEEFEGLLAGFKAGTMKYKDDGAEEDTKKAVGKVRDKGKAEIKGIIDDVYSRSFDDLGAELRGLHDDTVYYIGLLEEYFAELKALKEEENVIEFDDALHYAIDILENEEAAAELRDRFEYIFVDEYQDSNYLQEEIVGKIAREDNLFMVGDIKQCIYKFRLAEPGIFKAKARDFAEDSHPGLLLNISSNFRSKKNVTEPVNRVFDSIMEDYDESARLHCTAGDEHLGFEPRIHLIVNGEFDDEAPDKNDAEGAVIAGIIGERLGHEIYDAKKGVMRPLELGDFAVIVRNNKEVEDIERYLINEGIDAYGESGGKYFETVEVQVFINLLRIIENMRQDVPLISAMRSVVFGFTVKELAAIRIACREGSFSDAVLSYAGADGAAGGPDGAVDEALREKIRSMIRTVDVWKEISRTVPLEDLMKELLYSTGYYDYCSGLPVGRQRISNLRLIADKASKFEEMSHSGLYGFLRYVESMEDSDKTDSEAKVISEGENVVRVMSVHKSKGLEFPVVIFANASKGTEKADKGGRIKIHRKHGIGLPVINREEHWHRTSLLQKMIKNAFGWEGVEEEIRVLYVALTRAKDGLEIVGTVKTTDALDELAGDVSTKNFLEMMYWPLAEMEEMEVLRYDNADELARIHSRLMHTPAQLYELAEQLDNEELQKLADERLSYEYPHRSAAAIKPKYTVTELNRAAHAAKAGEPGSAAGDAGDGEIVIAAFDPDAAKRDGCSAGAAGGLTAAERGTIMHLLMEKADFAKAGDAGDPATAGELIRTTADRLLADDIITAEEYDSISVDKAAAFFASDIGRRASAAAKAGKLRKEKEFVYSMEVGGAAGEVEEPETTIVQGVIDCFFEEDDGIVLIDYKNSYMGAGRTEKDIRQTYAGQIDLYRRALEGATGKPVKEAYLYLFDTGTFVKM